MRNKRTKRILKPNLNGYLEVALYSDKRKSVRVHILVAKTFIPNPEPKTKTIVNHIDGDKTNNNVKNLEWVTPSESYKHAVDTGLIKRFNRSVYKIDKNGKILEEYTSIISAAKNNNISATLISGVCRGRGITAGGFYWCYVENYDTFKVSKRGDKIRRGVYQINKDTGNVIKEWPSLRDASQGTGIFYNNIIHACKKETRTSGGYKWKYVSKEDTKPKSEYDDWEKIPGFPRYRISRDGRVYSTYINQQRKLSNNKGYMMVELKYNGKKTNRGVHTLVAEVYIPNPKDKKYVNHINGNKSDNRVDNLEWATKSEDVLHARHTLGKGKKAVIRLDRDLNEMDRFTSIKEASESTGISYHGISKTCRGVTKTSGGYKWKFVE